jgi:tetratricopeptide (TPR) repeat protein
VENVCRKLDGIPLAVELAAAQVRLLKVPQIEKQLAKRFKTLVSAFGDVSQRQRTLRAAVDWSYDLLTEEEQLLFASLSVFQGGFSLDAVEAVCENDDAYSGVVRLREKSLLTLDDTLEVPRFNMLETLRDYGAEKLQETGLAHELAEKHARYFLEFAQENGPKVWEPEGDEAIADLSADLDDLRTAWEWLFLQSSADDVAALTISLSGFWEKQGHLREGRERMTRCLSREGDLRDGELHAKLLADAGWFDYMQADFASATEHSQHSLDRARELGDRDGQSNALNVLALAAQAQGQLEDASAWFEESLALAKSLGDLRKQADRLNNISILASRQGNLEQAREYLEEARALYRRLQDSFGSAACLTNLSYIALLRQNWAEVEALSRQSLDLFRRLSDSQGIAVSLTHRAIAATRQACHETALDDVREALTLCVNSGAHWLIPHLLECLGENRAAQRATRDALYCLIAARHLRDSMSSPRPPEEQAHLASVEEDLIRTLGDAAAQGLQVEIGGQPLETIIEGALHLEGQTIV